MVEGSILLKQALPPLELPSRPLQAWACDSALRTCPIGQPAALGISCDALLWAVATYTKMEGQLGWLRTMWQAIVLLAHRVLLGCAMNGEQLPAVD